MVDRAHLVAWYRRNRERSRALFDLITEEAYQSRPIALRHPLVFYDGHLPAFSFNTLVKKALGGKSIDPRLEALFARGIDPDEAQSTPGPISAPDPIGSGLRTTDWPDRATVRAFVDEADARVLDALANADVEQPGHAMLDRAEAVFCILEHEAMHQETLLYLWHRLPFDQKRRPSTYLPRVEGAPDPTGSGLHVPEWIDVPQGCATLGVDRGSIPFGWDNEFGACRADVPAFAIERHDVTNARYLEFMDAGGYQDARWWRAEDWSWIQSEGVSHPLFWERRDGQWFWCGMFEAMPLPLSWPVYVSYAEAAAFARWRGARLPTEAEFQRAAEGSWERLDGLFDFSSWDPEPAGRHPKGASAWGVEDLIGNGWEWTSTIFAPFPGFRPMASYPEYSADFFDGQHMVMKGASPATARELLRPTFRNWFRARYPYVYATFRCVKDSR